MKPRRIAAVAASVAAVWLVPASADALIQINQGIAGARINSTEAQVRPALGKPFRVDRGTNQFGPWREFRYRFGVRVLFEGRTTVRGQPTVSRVSTTGLGDRTRGGVGVGSRERTVRRIRDIRCGRIGSATLCRLGLPQVGRRVTTFRIRNGRVREVSIGFVLK